MPRSPLAMASSGYITLYLPIRSILPTGVKLSFDFNPVSRDGRGRLGFKVSRAGSEGDEVVGLASLMMREKTA